MTNRPSPEKNNFVYLLVLRLSRYLRLNTIVYLPVLLAGFIFLIGSLIVIQFYPNGAPSSFTGVLLLIMSIIASLSGLIQISIREVTGFPFRIQGRAAIWFGIVWIIVFGAVAICAIWYFLL